MKLKSIGSSSSNRSSMMGIVLQLVLPERGVADVVRKLKAQVLV